MIYWKSYFRDPLIEIPSTYTDEEFKEIILKSIAEVPTHFTVDDLFSLIGDKIEKGDRQNGYIIFAGNKMDYINRLIWEQIWDKKLMVDLMSKKDPFPQTDKIQFVKVI